MKLKSGMRGKDNGLLDLISELPHGLVMAEIGCYAGESTLMFLTSGKVKTLYAVDPWSGECKESAQTAEQAKRLEYVYANMKWAEQSFDIRIKPYSEVIKLKMTFSDAIVKLPQLDFVYIDGNHDYEYALDDIILAKVIVKRGGIIAGHDFSDECPGVQRAVKESFNGKIKKYKDTSWLMQL